jgi:hypothetical protein
MGRKRGEGTKPNHGSFEISSLQRCCRVEDAANQGMTILNELHGLQAWASQTWWHTPGIPAPRRRQKDHEFKTSLTYKTSRCK